MEKAKNNSDMVVKNGDFRIRSKNYHQLNKHKNIRNDAQTFRFV